MICGMKTIIKIKCSYCGKDMGEKDGEGVSGVSHSVCDKCFQAEMDSIKNELHNANIR